MHDAMDLVGMVGDQWRPWRAFWGAVYALPLSAEEIASYQRHTRRDALPSAPVAEAWMVIGRGGGKTRNSALHAFVRAITFDASTVAPNEDVIIPLIASDRRQAKAALAYIRGFHSLPFASPYVHRGELSWTIEYKTGCKIEIVTASKNAPRGFTCPSANCDEIAFWRSGAEDDAANPDSEVLTAVRGSLGRIKGSLLLVLSNPYAPKGELFNAVEQLYGRDDPDALVWIADTLSMNPTYDRRTIARAFKRDPVVAMSEFGADGTVAFRQAKVALFDAEPVANCVAIDRRELPPKADTRFFAFIDAAQGARSGDSMTLGIAHKDGGRAVLDLLREVEPPFSPGSVIVDQFAPILKQYGCREVQGDRHAIGFVQEFFEAVGIKFVASVHSKSDLYGELLPLVNSGLVELLDHPTLRNQMLALERRSVRGGRDSIDHPRGGHDDVANVAAGALVCVTGVGTKKQKRVRVFGAAGGEKRNPHDEMRELIAQTTERLDAQAKRDWEIEKLYEDEPMTSAPVWRVHQS